jgi:sugar O-acyltransferase (sialic acid O-acetyltransferase NeuD family)
MAQTLVIFGTSNIVSDLFDCAMAKGIRIGKIVPDLPEQPGERGVSLADRVAALAALGEAPIVQSMDAFRPGADELYILGPTTPTRAALAEALIVRFGLIFARLVHPSAYVSPLATLGPGVFIGANSVIGPGARLAEHVFVNRGVTIGHDTQIGPFSRIQPGSNVGGLSRYGRGVTIGIGATTVERLVVGDNAVIGAGAVVLGDVAADTVVVGVPARVKGAPAS